MLPYMSDPADVNPRRPPYGGRWPGPRDGKALDVTEADGAAARPGRRPRDLLDHAGAGPGRGAGGAGRPGVITYSRKVFIPLTRLCRDRCGYCTFATVPAQAADAPFLSPTRSWRSPGRARRMGCKEALFTLGDRPEDRWHAGREWLRRARLRRHPVLRARDGDPGAGGDRAAAAPEPGRA